MSFTVPEGVPSRIAAGDRIRWQASLPDFPPPEWTLTYYLKVQRDPNDNSGPLAVVATNNSGVHDIDIPAATSAALTVGSYYWNAEVTRASDPNERYRVGEGFLQVDANLSAVMVPHDARGQAQRILDAHLEAYENRAGRTEIGYSISAAGRSFTYFRFEELIKAIEYWRGIVATEKAAANLGKGRNIYVRFGVPS